MSAGTQTPTGSPGYAGYDAGESRGEGWVIFAGIMVAIAGVMNFIYGIAAIGNSHFFIANQHYVISSLSTWGWVVMLIGVFELCVALGIWVRAGWARWTGVALASLNVIAQLLLLPAYPLLAISIVALDILVIYGLVTYGGREEEGI